MKMVMFIEKKWWMECIGYQIYPKSFYDGNHDGYGDLIGIYDKLPYLKSLGINLIWICPFYDSPMDDNGYDIRDYFKINPLFGTFSDFKKLLARAKSLGIRVILDFVLNHTSDEHQWFIESRKSIDNKYRDYYIWHQGKKDNGTEFPPTNWGSFFGGSAWQKDEITGQYYMKIFSNKMPDLNWKNPEVIDEIIKVGKFWLDLGIDGFRIDAVSHLEKAEFRDSEMGKGVVLDWFKFSNLPRVHTYLKTLNKELFSQYDALTIGEVGGEAGIESAYNYAAFDANALSMVFNFDHNWCNNAESIQTLDELKVDLIALKNAFNKWQEAFSQRGWLPLNWLNHDQPRLVSHYGDLKYRVASAKMLATSLYLMRGTPFIFQGEEIGMTNYPFSSMADFEDVASIHKFKALKREGLSDESTLLKVSMYSRDNPRTAMQWSNGVNAGFTSKTSKVKINPNYTKINVTDDMKNQASIWYHYQKIIALRSQGIYKDVLIYGSYEQLEKTHPHLYVYRRYDSDYEIIVINSFSKETIEYQQDNASYMRIILNNYDDVQIKDERVKLKPYQSIVFVKKKEHL